MATFRAVNVHDGKVYDVPEENRESALNGGGFRPLTAGEEKELDLQSQYGEGWKNKLDTFVEGFTRGASGGLSDPAAIKGTEALAGKDKAEVVREGLDEHKRRNPGFAIAGEVVGTLVPTSVVGLVGKAGTKIASKVATKIGADTAKTAAGRIIKGAAAKGAGSAIEGAFYGAGQAASESALGDTELTAKKLAAYVGMGAVLNGTLGGALGLGGGTVKELSKKISSESMDQLASKLTAEQLRMTPTQRAKIDAEAMGQVLRDKGIKGVLSEEMVEKIATERSAAGAKMRSLMEKADEVSASGGAGTPGIDNDAILARMQKEILEPRAGKAPLKEQHEIAERFVGDFKEMHGQKPLSVMEGWELRRAYDDALYDARVSLQSARGKVLSQMREILDDAVDAKADQALSVLGPMEASALRAAKNEYHQLSNAHSIARSRVAAYATGGGGLRDEMAGTAAAATQAMMGGGVSLETMAVQKVASLANKSARENFYPAAAWAAEKTAVTLGKIERKVKEYDNKVTRAIASFVTETGKAAPRAVTHGFLDLQDATGSKSERFRQRMAKLDDLSNPSVLSASISKSVSEISQDAPQTAAAIGLTATNAVGFLRSKAPKNPLPPSVGNRSRSWVPTDAEMARWERYAQVVMDPNSALDHLAAGTLAPEHVEALQAVYPSLLDHVRSVSLKTLASQKNPIPYRKALQLSRLLGLDVDSLASSEMVASLQATYQAAAQAENEAQQGSEAPRLSESHLTGAQKVSRR